MICSIASTPRPTTANFQPEGNVISSPFRSLFVFLLLLVTLLALITTPSAHAQSSSGSCSDPDLEDCTTITIGEETTGTATGTISRGSADFYVLDFNGATASVLITVSITGAEGAGELVPYNTVSFEASRLVTTFGAEPSRLAFVYAIDLASQMQSPLRPADEFQTYYIRIFYNPQTNDTGSYTLHVETNPVTMDECTDDTSTECKIMSDDPVTASITHGAIPDEDKDWWRLDLDYSVIPHSIALHTSGTLQTNGTLYLQEPGETAPVSVAADDNGGSGDNFSLTHVVYPSSGTYYINVGTDPAGGGFVDVGGYTLNMMSTPTAEDYCTNNINTPCTVASGVPGSEFIRPANDRDRWELDFGDATASLLVTAYSTGNLDTTATLYRMTTSIHSNDEPDEGVDTSFIYDLVSNFSLVYPVDPGTTHYIEVHSDTVGVYTLHIETNPMPTENCSSDESTGCTIAAGEQKVGLVLVNVNNEDWYELDFGDATASLFVTLRTTGDDTSIRGDYYEQQGSAMATNINFPFEGRVDQDSHNFSLEYVFDPTAERTYYVQVENYGDNPGVYTLHMEANPAPMDSCTGDTSTPCTIAAGEQKVGLVLGRNEDWYELDFGDATAPTFVTVYAENNFDSVGSLYLQKNTEAAVSVFSNDDSIDGANFSLAYPVDPSTGTYYIGVRSFYQSEVSEYTIRMDANPTPTEDCTADTSTPCTISPGESQTGYRLVNDDADWWRLDLTDFASASTPVFFTLYTTGNDLDTVATLWLQQDPTSTPASISQNDNNREGLNFSLVNNANPGTYYIDVAILSTGRHNVPGIYTLHMEAAPAPTEDCTADTSTPCTISPGESQTGYRLVNDDADWWRLDLTDFASASLPVLVTLYTTGNDLDTVATLYLQQDPAAAPVSVFQDDSEDLNFSLVYALTRGMGTYYAAVETTENLPGIYTLHMEAAPAPLTFTITEPSSVVTFAVDDGRIGGVGNASVMCPLVSYPAGNSCDDISLTAFLAAGACSARPTDAAGTSNCERIDSNGASLTLSYGGLHSVWWAGSNAEHSTVADNVAEYYVPPVLGLGADFYIPADESVYVTVAAGSYGAGKTGDTAVLTLSLSVTPGLSSQETVTVSGHVATNVVFDNVSLADGETATVVLSSEGFASSLYTPGRTMAVLTATSNTSVVSADEVRAFPVLRICNAEHDVIAASLTGTGASCPGGGTPRLTMSVEVQRWVGITPVTLTANWINRSGNTVSSVAVTPSVWSPGAGTYATAAITNTISVGHTLELQVIRVTTTPAATATLATKQYPVAPVAAVESPSQRAVFASENQTINFGRYGKRADVFDLSAASSVASFVSQVPSALLAGPPGYATGSPGSPIYDFSVRLIPGVTVASVILQFPEALPGNPVYYKYRETIRWSPFITTSPDAIYSSSDFPCPKAEAAKTGNDMWSPGLNTNHRCVLLVVSDGGPNDADGERNGIVVDPSAVGRSAVSSGGGGGGGTLGYTTLSVLLLVLLMSLSLIGRRDGRVLFRKRHRARPF